jgi:hypothetical protein
MDFGLRQPIIIEVVDAGIGEIRVQGAQVGQIEMEFIPVVDAGQKSD